MPITMQLSFSQVVSEGRISHHALPVPGGTSLDVPSALYCSLLPTDCCFHPLGELPSALPSLLGPAKCWALSTSPHSSITASPLSNDLTPCQELHALLAHMVHGLGGFVKVLLPAVVKAYRILLAAHPQFLMVLPVPPVPCAFLFLGP